MTKRKTKTKSVETSHATTTPNVPSWLSQPYQTLAGNVAGLMGSQPQTIGPTQTQQNAFTQAAGLGHYQPTQISAGQLSGTDLTPYMNPYTNEVIDRSLGDLNRITQGQISENQGRATAAGAYGGSRHGVTDSGIYEGAQRTGGDLAAGLRNQGFMNAQNAAQFDIGNRLTADQFNTSQQTEAERLNQSGIGLMGDLGAQERAIQTENDRYMQRVKALLIQSGLLGSIPGQMFTGNTVDATGTSNSTTTQTPSGLDTIGQLAQLGMMLFGKPGGGGG